MFEYKSKLGEERRYPTYRGVPMQQNRGVFEPVVRLLQELRPTIIVELSNEGDVGSATSTTCSIVDAATKAIDP